MTAKIEMIFLCAFMMLTACDSIIETTEDVQSADLSKDPKVY